MTQKNCPNCESSRTNYVQNYGYWECKDCGHEWALDEDDPDYDDLSDIPSWVLDRELCSKCDGGGLIQIEGELVCYPKCEGSGST